MSHFHALCCGAALAITMSGHIATAHEFEEGRNSKGKKKSGNMKDPRSKGEIKSKKPGKSMCPDRARGVQGATSAKKLYSNGCGVPGVFAPDLSQEYGIVAGKELENCCHVHDVCYSVCGMTQRECDRDFEQCLTNTCDDLFSIDAEETKDTNKKCKYTANTFSIGASLGGAGFWEKAQKQVCECVKETEVKATEEKNLYSVYREMFSPSKSAGMKFMKDVQAVNENKGIVLYNELKAAPEKIRVKTGTPKYQNIGKEELWEWEVPSSEWRDKW